ncbi:MAG: hypothetical protein ACR5K2_02400 [Wolbachia sp.]
MNIIEFKSVIARSITEEVAFYVALSVFYQHNTKVIQCGCCADEVCIKLCNFCVEACLNSSDYIINFDFIHFEHA